MIRLFWNLSRDAGEYSLNVQVISLEPVVEEPNAIADAELLRQAMAGDESAFRSLYDRLKKNIFRYAFYMTNSRAAAEEITQEVFMTLLEKGKSFNAAHGDLGAFTFGMARNIVRRVERRERSWRARFHEYGDKVEVATPEALTGNLLRAERVAQVRVAIVALPDHYRQVVVLCDLCEFSYAEAAARLDCAVGTIRSRLNRAHALLAQKLKLLGDIATEMRDAGAEGCLT